MNMKKLKKILSALPEGDILGDAEIGFRTITYDSRRVEPGDLFGDWVDPDIIHRVLQLCRKYPSTTYLFQSKNPGRFKDFMNYFPMHTIFGTTIETTDMRLSFQHSEAPLVTQRYSAMRLLREYDKMISIEPIMDFDLPVMVDWMRQIKLKFVSIGADSKGHNLPEPSGKKVRKLIAALEMQGIEVKLKSNLERLKQMALGHEAK